MDSLLGCWYRGWLKEMNRIRVYGMKVRDGEQIIVREIVIDPITRRVRDTDTLTVDDMRDVTNIGTPGKRRQEGRVLR